jgi:hypothetical protein
MNDFEQSSPPEPARRPEDRRMLSNRRGAWIVAIALMLVVGLSVGVAVAPSATVGHVVPGSGVAGRLGFGGRGSNARSGPAQGGALGTAASVSMSSFTLSTSTGQKVIVDETSSTTYHRGATSIPASAVTTGVGVLVLGTTGGATITANQVIVEPTGVGATTSSAAKVIPFQRGVRTTSTAVGQIPANWSQGSGLIIGGTRANKATEAALAAYPGGVVDRVVKLSNGEYNVHIIGVDWPHHVFVNQVFKVIGAE